MSIWVAQLTSVTYIDGRKDLALGGGLDSTLREECIGPVGVGDPMRPAAVGDYGPVEVL